LVLTGLVVAVVAAQILTLLLLARVVLAVQVRNTHLPQGVQQDQAVVVAVVVVLVPYLAVLKLVVLALLLEITAVGVAVVVAVLLVVLTQLVTAVTERKVQLSLLMLF
jgi:hypothetical protein